MTSKPEHDASGPARRMVLAGAVGVAATAGAAQAAVATKPAAKGRGAAIESGAEPSATAPYTGMRGGFWRGSYTATKRRGDQGIELAIYRKRLEAPGPRAPARPVLFLVHGSSNAALSSYDLAVPGGTGEYSSMSAFARAGFDVWTMDHENYGRSSRTDGNSDIASGAADLLAAAEVVRRETGQTRFNLLGESSGALRAGLFAMNNPDRVDRLALAAMTYTGKGSPTLTERAKQIAAYRASNRRKRDREMIRSIFTRDRPGTTDLAVGEALADAELVYGDTAPTGTYLDMSANLPVVDPTRLTVPVLVVRGEYDGIATDADLLDFYGKLPHGDRQFIVIPAAAHSLVTCKNRALFEHAVIGFLKMPRPVPV